MKVFVITGASDGTTRGKLGRFVKPPAPGLVENMALAALSEEARAE